MFLERFQNYLRFEKRFSTHTVNAYLTDLNQFQGFLITLGLNFSQARHNHIRTWMVHLMDQGTEARTLGRKLSSLRTFYKFLQREKLMELNPSLQVRAPKLPKKLPVVIENSKINDLLDGNHFSQDFEGKRDRLVIEILFGTGIRLSELISIKKSDIDFYERHIRIFGKRQKERIIPVTTSLINLIKEYLDERRKLVSENHSPALIVKKDGRQAYPTLIYRIVKRYLDEVTTKQKKSPHILRHSFATGLLDNGADINAIKELLGHASLAATQIYTHNSVEKLKLIYKQAHPRALTKEER